MANPETERNPVEQLAEEFLERYRRGELPSISEYTSLHPDYASEIKELFPALVMMEKVGLAEDEKRAQNGSGIHAVEKPPLVLGDYRILREIGRGGMGIVYEAEQSALGRRVALKVLPHSISADPVRLQRFRSEARFAARLHHTNIVPVFEVGENDGLHYYAMQYIQGQGLDEVIVELRRLRKMKSTHSLHREQAYGEPKPTDINSSSCSLANNLINGEFCHGPLDQENRTSGLSPTEQERKKPADQPASCENSKSSGIHEAGISDISHQTHAVFYRSVARIGLQIAEALSYAHQQKVMHRDIKPANLLLDGLGTIWITDFGLAKVDGVNELTQEGDIVGTLRYMAPERFKGISNPRADLYSLGMTLYELLTLHSPYEAKDYGSLIKKVLHEELPTPRTFDPYIPLDLETILLKAIAKEPHQRYDSAAAFAEDLRRFLSDRPIQARRISFIEHARKWSRRNPGWAAAVLLTSALLLLIAIGGTILNVQLQKALTDAQTAEKDKTEKLWQSYLEKARAERSSGRVGQRFEALKAIREAAKIKITPELRDEAVAALVLPDVKVVQEWDGWTDDTFGLAFDNSYRRFVRLHKDGGLTACQVTSQGEQTIARLPAFGKPPIFLMQMSPDGRYFAYGHTGDEAKGPLRIWDIDKQESWDVPGGVVGKALAFHMGSHRVAIGHGDRTISIFDLRTKEMVNRFRINQDTHNLAFHPDGELLAVAGGKIVRIVNVKNLQERPPLIHDNSVTWLEGLAWHPDGRRLVTSGVENRLHLWDTLTGAELMTSPEQHLAQGVYLSFNQTGDYLACAGYAAEAQIWDITANRLVLNLLPMMPKFNHDDSLFGWRRLGSRIQLLQFEQGHEMRNISRVSAPVTEQIGDTVIDPDGRLLVFTSKQLANDLKYHQWLTFIDLHRGCQVASIRLPFGDEGQAVPRGFLGEEYLITGGLNGTLLWPMRKDKDDERLLRIGPPRRIGTQSEPSLGLDKQGHVIAIPYRSNALVLDQNQPGMRRFIGPLHDVRRCAVSPSGRWIVTCGWHTDGKTPCATIWESADLHRFLDLPLVSTTNAQFSPDERWLVTDCDVRGTEVWDVASWKLLRRYGQASLLFMPDHQHLAIADQPGTIRIVHIESDREVFRLSGPESLSYRPVAVSSDGRQLIAYNSQYKALHVWDLPKIRSSLRQLDMDWDWPDIPDVASQPDKKSLRAVHIEPGFLRARPFDDDRETISFYNFCLALQPINPDAYWNRGLAHDRLRQWDKAIRDFQLLLNLIPSTDPRGVEVHCLLAKNYFQSNQYARTAQELQSLLSTPAEQLPWPDLIASICHDIAWEYSMDQHSSQRPVNLISIARKAVDLEPFSSRYQNILGLALYRSARYQDAIDCLEQNLKAHSEAIGYNLFFLAMSYQAVGQQSNARKAYDRACNWHNQLTNLPYSMQKRLSEYRAEATAALGMTVSPH